MLIERGDLSRVRAALFGLFLARARRAKRKRRAGYTVFTIGRRTRCSGAGGSGEEQEAGRRKRNDSTRGWTRSWHDRSTEDPSIGPPFFFSLSHTHTSVNNVEKATNRDARPATFTLNDVLQSADRPAPLALHTRSGVITTRLIKLVIPGEYRVPRAWK